MREPLLAVTLLMAAVGRLNGATIITNGVGQVVQSGAQTIRLSVVGDGFTAADADSAVFAKAVRDLRNVLFTANLGNHVIADRAAQFTLCEVQAFSKHSGVSTPDTTYDTAFGTIYTGDQQTCWVKADAAIDAKVIDRVTAECGETVDYAFVVVKPTDSDNGGGCARDKLMYLSVNGAGRVARHELGHALGALYDEYATHDVPPLGLQNDNNCATTSLPAAVPWHEDLDLTKPVSTDPQSAARGILGVYEGCDSVITGVYRPSSVCNMYHLGLEFCKVCSAILKRVIDGRVSALTTRPTDLSLVASLLVKVPRTGEEAEMMSVLPAPRKGEFEESDWFGRGWIISIGDRVIGRVAASVAPFEWRSSGAGVDGIETRIDTDYAVLALPVRYSAAMISSTGALSLDLVRASDGKFPTVGDVFNRERILKHWSAESLRPVLLRLATQ